MGNTYNLDPARFNNDNLRLSRLESLKYKNTHKQRLSFIRLTTVSISSIVIAIFSSLLDYQPFSIFGFDSIAAFFGLNGLAILILCKEARDNSENFNYYSFLKLVVAFSFLTILINHFIGSYSITGHRLYILNNDYTRYYFLFGNRKPYCDVIYYYRSFHTNYANNRVFNSISNFPRKIWRYVYYSPNLYFLFSCLWLHWKGPTK